MLLARGQAAQARHFAIERLHVARNENLGVGLLEAAVGLASRLGEFERAARFWGAADHTLGGWGCRHRPVDVEHTAPLIAASRSALGDAAFEAAGRGLASEDALLELEQWLERGT